MTQFLYRNFFWSATSVMTASTLQALLKWYAIWSVFS